MRAHLATGRDDRPLRTVTYSYIPLLTVICVTWRSIPQGEMIERIDANADATIGNVEEAHTQILKYKSYVAGRRKS